MMSIRNITRIIQNPFKQLLFQSNYQCAKVDLKIQHYSQMTLRAHRRKFLNRAVLSQKRQVIYAQMRKPTDGIISLRNQGKCPAVMRFPSQNQEDEMDVILNGKDIRKLMKSQSYKTDRVFVRIQGKQYQCVFKKAKMFDQKFIQMVDLQVYEPGKPNKLTIPIEVTHLTQNPYIQYHECKFYQKRQFVDIICYNEEYPQKFFLDISYLSPDRGYKIGDLANTFPPGMVLDLNQSPYTKVFTLQNTEVISEDQRLRRIEELKKLNKKKDKKVQKK